MRRRRELDELNAGQVGAPVALVVVSAPLGFAQIYPGYNVWQVWQSQDPIQGLGGTILNAGLSLERQLRIWVEDWIRNHAPAAEVADDKNILDVKGGQIEILPNPAGLKLLQTRGDVPGLAGALQLGEKDSKALLFTVRFYNRGKETTATAWPHDENYVLDAVYEQDPNNPLTSGAPPSTVDGALDDLSKQAGSALKVVAIVGGVAIGAYLLVQILNAQKGGNV